MIFMYRVFLFLFLSLLIVNSLHANELRLEFVQIPELIKRGNTYYESAKLKLEAAEIRKGFLMRSFLPHVEAFAGAEDFKRGLIPERRDPFYGATFEMNLFRGQRDLLFEKALGAKVLGAKAYTDEIYLDKLLESRKAFWEYVSAMELKKIIQEAISYNSKNLNSTKKRISAGIGTDTDQLEFEIKEQELVQSLSRLESSAKVSEMNLKAFLTLDSELTIKVPDQIPMPDEGKFSEIINVETVPRLVKELSESKKAKFEKSMALNWWLPQLNLYGGYLMKTMRESDEYRTQDRDEAFVGVKISVNFDALQDFNESKAMASEALAAQKQYQQTLKETKALYQSSSRELRQNQELIASSNSIRQKAKFYLMQTLNEYKRGVKNSADVSSATDKFIDAETRFVELKKNYHLNHAQLLSLLGRGSKENEMY